MFTFYFKHNGCKGTLKTRQCCESRTPLESSLPINSLETGVLGLELRQVLLPEPKELAALGCLSGMKE